MREASATGAFGHSKTIAIRLAQAAASVQGTGNNLKITVYSMKDGKRTKEWATH
jgi:hypothetical protein